MKLFTILNILLLLAFVPSNATDTSTNRPILKTFIPELDQKLNESSGLIYWKDHLWTINDSGGENELYGIDLKTGKIAITVKIANAKNVDWESLTQDDDFIYIGDFGNNFGSRKDLKIIKVEKIYISNSSNQIVRAEIIEFNYNNQMSFEPTKKLTAFDCEGFTSYNDQLILFSKNWESAVTSTYISKNSSGSYSLKPQQKFNIKMYVTGADISKDGKLALIGYFDFKSYLWIFDITKDSFFENPKMIDLSYIGYAQTEAICFMENRLLISCEENENYKAQVWEVDKYFWKD